MRPRDPGCEPGPKRDRFSRLAWLRHPLEDHAMALAVGSLDLHHSAGHHSAPRSRAPVLLRKPGECPASCHLVVPAPVRGSHGRLARFARPALATALGGCPGCDAFTPVRGRAPGVAPRKVAPSDRHGCHPLPRRARFRGPDRARRGSGDPARGPGRRPVGHPLVGAAADRGASGDHRRAPCLLPRGCSGCHDRQLPGHVRGVRRPRDRAGCSRDAAPAERGPRTRSARTVRGRTAGRGALRAGPAVRGGLRGPVRGDAGRRLRVPRPVRPFRGGPARLPPCPAGRAGRHAGRRAGRGDHPGAGGDRGGRRPPGRAPGRRRLDQHDLPGRPPAPERCCRGGGRQGRCRVARGRGRRRQLHAAGLRRGDRRADAGRDDAPDRGLPEQRRGLGRRGAALDGRASGARGRGRRGPLARRRRNAWSAAAAG